MSKAQIDRLGDRLRAGVPNEDDLRQLTGYRQSFAPAYQEVVELIRARLGVAPTGRPAKSTTAIVEKLRRESIRLSQIQDIAGARIVVSDLVRQDEIVQELGKLFDRVNVVDRRQKPSHGYRAVHVVPQIGDAAIEVQVRTTLQHHWAEISEKLSDVIDHSIKYGGGPQKLRETLLSGSAMIAKLEALDPKLAQVQARASLVPPEIRAEIDELAREQLKLQTQAHDALDNIYASIRKLGEGAG